MAELRWLGDDDWPTVALLAVDAVVVRLSAAEVPVVAEAVDNGAEFVGDAAAADRDSDAAAAAAAAVDLKYSLR